MAHAPRRSDLQIKKKDIYSWWEVPCIAHFCSLFRVSFNLIDFDIEDLEEALLTDDALAASGENEDDGDGGGSTLLQELMVRLLRGYYGNNNISTFNYQMFLRRLFRQKCREFNCYNPFDNDIDFQFLPLRTKVEILHMLCDFRLDAEDVFELLKDLDSDSLRVHPLGYDTNRSAYWYFYGTRLYREDYPKSQGTRMMPGLDISESFSRNLGLQDLEKPKKEKRRGRKRKRLRPKSESEDEDVRPGTGIWRVICFTESDWERLALDTEDAVDKKEQRLHHIIADDFLPEIPKLFIEKERSQRKRYLELHPRKSSRIEKLRQRKEELDKFTGPDFDANLDEPSGSENESGRTRSARHERWKNRNQNRSWALENSSDSDSTRTESGRSSSMLKQVPTSSGRQTNNSLANFTGDIHIRADPSKSPSPPTEWFDTQLEDLHIGMYKVLNKLKDHEDAWPFLQPVDVEDAPGYYDVVKSPMSLQWMEEKLDDGQYLNLNQFREDFELILANCRQYNGCRNEYTQMCKSLEKVFSVNVNRYILLMNSSDSDSPVEGNETEVIGAHKRRRRKQRRQLSNNKITEDDRDVARKLVAMSRSCSVRSLDSESRNDDDSRSEDSDSRSTTESKPTPARGRSLNSNNIDSLDSIAEQTIRDINKWLDDTPKFNDFNSTNDAYRRVMTDGTSSVGNEISHHVPKPVRTYKPRDPNKKRVVKDTQRQLQLIKQQKRDVHRTIDRLQPGKSKGNLIGKIVKQNGDDVDAKCKEVQNEPTHRPKPILSLGSVLSSDMIKVEVNTKKRRTEDGLTDDEDSENEENVEPVTELKAENLAVDKTNVEKVPEKGPKVEETVAEPEVTKSEDKSEKQTPNLQAWLKAFGLPKSQTPKRKEAEEIKPEEKYDEPPPPTPGRFLTYDEEPKPNRRLSTGSSVSEQSSHEPEVSSPHPSLDEPYPSPRQYHQSPVHPIKVGFYQDAFPKSNSCSPCDPLHGASPQHGFSPRESLTSPRDSLASPRDLVISSRMASPASPMTPRDSIHSPRDSIHSPRDVICSPRESIHSPRDVICSPRESIHSPRDVICSPRESIHSPRDSIHSPRDVICSPRDSIHSPRDSIHSPRDVICSPRESIHSPRESIHSPRYAPAPSPKESIHSPHYLAPSPLGKSPVYEPAEVKSPEVSIAKSPFPIYPAKKRIFADTETFANEPHFPLPFVSDASRHLPPYVDYQDVLISNPFFRKQLYEQISQAETTRISSLFTQQKMAMSSALSDLNYNDTSQSCGARNVPLDYTRAKMPDKVAGKSFANGKMTYESELKPFTNLPESVRNALPTPENIYRSAANTDFKSPHSFHPTTSAYANYTMPDLGFPSFNGDQVDKYYQNERANLLPMNSLPMNNFGSLMNGKLEANHKAEKSTKRSKKKKIVSVAETVPAQVSSPIYSSYLGQSPVDLKNNMVPGSAFNFAANPMKNDYQQYFENLRNTRYFADANTVPEKRTAPSFPFLGTSPFGQLSQLMNGSTSMYSSPFLPRPSDELLRPMMLQQGLMPPPTTHYPQHPYLNMHDPVNRSPWLPVDEHLEKLPQQCKKNNNKGHYNSDNVEFESVPEDDSPC